MAVFPAPFDGGGMEEMHEPRKTWGVVRPGQRASWELDEEEVDEEGSFLSVRVVFPAIAIFAIVVAVSVSTSMVTRSYEEALSSTNSMSDAALDDGFNLTETLLRENTRSLLATSSDTLIGMIAEGITTLQKEVEWYNRVITNHYRYSTLPKDNIEWLRETRFHIYNLAKTYLYAGTDAFAVTINDNIFLAYATHAGIQGEWGVIIEKDGTPTDLKTSQVFTANSNLTKASFLYSAQIAVEDDPFTRLVMRGVIKPNETVWGKLRYFTELGGMLLTAHLVDPYTGAHIAPRVYMSASRYQMILGSLITTLQYGDSSDLGTRIFGVQASSPLADRLPLDDAFRYVLDSTGTISFTSHGLAHRKVNSTLNMFYTDTQHSDPIIRASTRYIHTLNESYASIARSPTPSVIVPLPQIGSYYLQVNELKMNFEGYHLWMVFCIPYDFLIRGMSERIQANRNRVTEERERLNRRIELDRFIVMIISGAITVGMAVFVAVLTSYMIHPIKKLQKEMSYVAQMRLDQHFGPVSVLREVQLMEVSFRKMVRNLKEFKAYVPNAVLNRSTQDNSLVIDPPSGKALCFAFLAQRALMEQNWPPELELPTARGSDGKVKIAGLPVRMGAHYGHVVVEENPITGRADYRGGVVNMASRVEGKAKAGAVCCTEAFLTAIKPSLTSTSADLSGSMHFHGTHDLKGIGKVPLYLLVPTSLKERLQDDVPESDDGHSSTGPSNRPHDSSSTSSTHPSRLSSTTALISPFVGQIKKTGLFLQKLEATVAVCKLLDVGDQKIFEAYNQVVRCAADTAVVTDGALLALCGNSLMLAWNTMKTTRMHASAAMQFAGELTRRCRLSVVRVGTATGPVQHGNVGTVAKRFNNVMGKTVTVASLAADLCVRYGLPSMAADFTSNLTLAPRANISSVLRLVDIWLDVSTNRKVLLYQLQTAKLREHFDGNWQSAEDFESIQFESVFRDAMSGEQLALQELRATAETDPVVR
eukprot:gene5468-8329_t